MNNPTHSRQAVSESMPLTMEQLAKAQQFGQNRPTPERYVGLFCDDAVFIVRLIIAPMQKALLTVETNDEVSASQRHRYH